MAGGVKKQLDKLETFVDVLRWGSVREASSRVGVSEHLLAKSIESLEKSLDAKLFVESAGRLVLSDTGKMLRPFAQRWLREVAEFEQSLKSIDFWKRSPLRVGATETLAKNYLPGVVPELERLGYQVQVDTQRSDGLLIDQLLGEEYQLIFVANPPEILDVATISVFSDQLALHVLPSLAEERFNERRGDSVPLKPVPIYYYPQGRFEPEVSLANQLLGLQNRNFPLIPVESYSLAKQFALEGLGMGLFPKSLGLREVGEGRLEEKSISLFRGRLTKRSEIAVCTLGKNTTRPLWKHLRGNGLPVNFRQPALRTFLGALLQYRKQRESVRFRYW